MKLAVLTGAACLLGGCATVTTSPSQDVTVLTVPAGASCDLLRGGTLPVGTIVPTPGALRIGKSAKPTFIRCRLAEHADAEGVLEPSFQPLTLGNLLIGGLVGILVDIGTGAAARYPDAVTLILPRLDGRPIVPPVPDPPGGPVS